MISKTEGRPAGNFKAGAHHRAYSVARPRLEMNRAASSSHSGRDVNIVNRNPFGQRAAAVNGIAKCGWSQSIASYVVDSNPYWRGDGRTVDRTCHCDI